MNHTAKSRKNDTVGWHNWSAVLLQAESVGVSERRLRQLCKFLYQSGLYRQLQGFWGRTVRDHYTSSWDRK